MYVATIDSNEIHRRAYLVTAAKSRFVTDKGYEQYTFDTDSQDIEDLSKLTETLNNITVEEIETDIDDVVKKVVTLKYPLLDIENELSALTRQKGRNVLNGNGMSMLDLITFAHSNSSSQTISPSKDGVYSLCRHVTAKKAKALVTSQGANFDILTLTNDEQDKLLFDALYERAFFEMLGEMAILVSGFTDQTSFTVVAGFPGSVGGAIVSSVENYLFSNIMSQFYRIAGLNDESTSYASDAAAYIIKAKNHLSSQADSTALLDAIIRDAGVRLQTALYPISKRSLSSVEMFNVTGTDVEFSFELAKIPISSSAIQLIYNLGRQMLINGALAKWYTMAGISDDRNEAKLELEKNVDVMSFIVNDRLRFVGLFSQYLMEAVNNIRERLLAYTKSTDAIDYTMNEETGYLTFNLSIPDWEIAGQSSVNFQNQLLERMKDTLYRYVLKEWWRLTNVAEFQIEQEYYNQAIDGMSNALNLRYKPIVRSGTWM